VTKAEKPSPPGAAGEDLLERVIRGSPFFKTLEEPLISALRSIALPRRFRPGETIFLREDPASSVYLVESGKVRIYVSDLSGKERSLKIAEAGDLFGEAAVFQTGGYPASSSALGEVSVLEFPKGSLLKLVRANPELAFAAIGILASRLRELTTLIRASLKELEPRLCGYLLSLPAENGRVKLPVRKVELSRLLGATPESLSRAFNRLKSGGLIKEERGWIHLPDRERLEELSLSD
jgi:CRP/FNR family transcriptional regulator